DGFSTPVGFYAFMAPIASPRTEHIVHAIAAALIVNFVLFHLPTRRLLSGSMGRQLGRLSFPLYLVHMPILRGIGHPLHLFLSKYLSEGFSILLTFISVGALTLLAAIPLLLLDEWWVGVLRDIPFRNLLRSRASVT